MSCRKISNDWDDFVEEYGLDEFDEEEFEEYLQDNGIDPTTMHREELSEWWYVYYGMNDSLGML
jgi:hypothetical protein